MSNQWSQVESNRLSSSRLYGTPPAYPSSGDSVTECGVRILTDGTPKYLKFAINNMCEILTLLFFLVVVPIFEDEVNDPQSTGAPYHVTEEHRHWCVLTGDKQNAEEQHCNDDACKNFHDFLY